MQNHFSYENNQQYSFQMDYNYYPQQPCVPNNFQQQYVPPQQVEATNGPSNREVMILMGEVIEKLESVDERLRVDQ